MKSKILIVVLIFLGFTSEAQENFELKQQLDSLYYKDQVLREIFMGDITGEEKKKILAAFGHTVEEFDARNWPIIAYQDSLNLVEAEKIISEFGYPGKSLVGEPTNKAIWYVIQHSDKIEQYFPLMQKAGDEGELPNTLVGMMHDRLLMGQNKPQIYGTQVAGRKIEATGEWFQFVWPIAEPKKANELRALAGFTNTVEENAKRLDVVYKTYSLKEIDSILTVKQ